MFGELDALAAGGGQGLGNSSSGQQTSQTVLQNFDVLNRGAGQLEQNTYNGQLSDYAAFQGLTNAGAGNQAVSDALTGAYGYTGLLQQLTNNQGLPSQQQQQYAQTYAQQQFAPQQTALQQQFVRENQQGARLAASLGRSGADPVLQAKLATQQGWEQQQLNAQQGQLASQTAMNMPQQQMQYANQLYNVQQGLASQAFNNRSALLQMGNQLNNSERQYRMGTAFKNNEFGQSGWNSTAPGGFQGQVAGFQSGTGAEMGMVGGLISSVGSGASGIAKMAAM